MEVHGNAEQIAGRALHLANAVPSFPDPEEGVLRKILGLGAIVDDQTECPVQAGVLGLDEVLESPEARGSVRTRSTRLICDVQLVLHPHMNVREGEPDYRFLEETLPLTVLGQSM
jgi:hypothetical protein